jgi:PPOX class probable FMN-dependent enzyme
MKHTLTTLAELETIYGEPSEAALVKVTDRMVAPYRRLIEASPFFVLATNGSHGLDCSPRGDAAGFVRVADERTLLIPDRRGNNRIDSLRNIVRDPRVALLFLIPGVGETLRVRGRAAISVEPTLIESFVTEGKPPRSVVVVTAEAVYFQMPEGDRPLRSVEPGEAGGPKVAAERRADSRGDHREQARGRGL